MVKVAILHEGNADKSLDNEILKLLLTKIDFNINQVEFFGFGNKSNFFKKDNPKYKRLKLQIDEQEINKILFVVDADYKVNDSTYGGLENTTNELNNIIRELSFSSCSDIYVTCDPSKDEGYLESLILSTISKEQKECIETFLKCSDFESKENHKAILNQIYKSAYPKAPYDFSHKNFDDLKLKLQNLFK